MPAKSSQIKQVRMEFWGVPTPEILERVKARSSTRFLIPSPRNWLSSLGMKTVSDVGNIDFFTVSNHIYERTVRPILVQRHPGTSAQIKHSEFTSKMMDRWNFLLFVDMPTHDLEIEVYCLLYNLTLDF